MGRVRALREYNARIDAWLVARPVVFFVLLAVPPVLVFVGLEYVRDGHLVYGLVNGVVFGVVYASITVAVRRWRAKRTD